MRSTLEVPTNPPSPGRWLGLADHPWRRMLCCERDAVIDHKAEKRR